MTAIEFFDSESGQWPPAADYAALYADSSLGSGGYNPQISRVPNKRYITRRGGSAAAAYAGIADFENHNLVYTGELLEEWAYERGVRNMRARVYCDRSDVRLAWPQVGHLDNVVWWIATLDNNPHWTPALIVASVRAVSGITLPEDKVWGIQWGTNRAYDTSYLTGQW